MDAESRWLVEKEFRERLSNNSRIRLVREFWHKTLFFLTCFNFEEKEKESSRCWKPPSFWNEFWPFRLLLCSKPTGVRLDMLHCRCRLCVYRVIKRRRRSFAVANKSWRCVKKKRRDRLYMHTQRRWIIGGWCGQILWHIVSSRQQFDTRRVFHFGAFFSSSSIGGRWSTDRTSFSSFTFLLLPFSYFMLIIYQKHIDHNDVLSTVWQYGVFVF